MIFVVAALFFLGACASSQNQFGETGTSSGKPVPGEKAASGPDVMPASSGSSAGARVGW